MLFQWLKSRRNHSKDLETLNSALRASGGDAVSSVIVFGSLVSGEFRADRSNVNVLVVTDVSPEGLKRIGGAVKAWVEKGHVPPILIDKAGLQAFARSFPIEFLDMLDEHRVVSGDDPLTGLHVDTKHLRAQCEHDLALAQLRLRQAFAIAQDQRKPLERALKASWPSVSTLMRAALRVEENATKLDKIKAIDRLAEKIGFETDALHHLHDEKLQRETDNMSELASDYLKAIDAVLNHLRK